MKYKVPFYSNTPDNTHCHQASIKSVLKYFVFNRNFSFSQLDKLSDKKEGLWTWGQRSNINMIKMGFDVVDIDDWNIDEFVKTGRKYLIKKYGKEVADIQEKNSDLESARKNYKEFGTYKVHENRVAEVSDIKNLLKEGYLVCCNINSKALNNIKGYSGHYVVIFGYDKINLLLHDPGLPPQPNRKVTYEQFTKAWAYPDKGAQNLTAFRLNKNGFKELKYD